VVPKVFVERKLFYEKQEEKRKMFSNIKRSKKGFSLVELIVVIAIMAVLVGVLAPSLLVNIEKSRESKDVQVIDTIAGAVQMALADEEAEAVKVTTKTKLADILGAATPNAFQKAVKDNLGGKTIGDITLSSASAKTGDIYVEISATGGVLVTIEKNGAVVQADKTKSDFKVTR